MEEEPLSTSLKIISYFQGTYDPPRPIQQGIEMFLVKDDISIIFEEMEYLVSKGWNPDLFEECE